MFHYCARLYIHYTYIIICFMRQNTWCGGYRGHLTARRSFLGTFLVKFACSTRVGRGFLWVPLPHVRLVDNRIIEPKLTLGKKNVCLLFDSVQPCDGLTRESHNPASRPTTLN